MSAGSSLRHYASISLGSYETAARWKLIIVGEAALFRARMARDFRLESYFKVEWPLHPLMKRVGQAAHLYDIEPCFNFEALPPEIQVAIIGNLEYEDLKCFELVSTAMRQLVATPNPVLDAELFRSSFDLSTLLNLTASVDPDSSWGLFGRLPIQVHPLVGAGMMGALTSSSRWLDAKFTSRTSHLHYPENEFPTYKFKEIKENATYPAALEIHLRLWDGSMERAYSAITPTPPFEEPLSQAIEVIIKGQPVTVEQFLKGYFAGMAAVSRRLERHDRYNIERHFASWNSLHVRPNGSLHLLEPRWRFQQR